MISVHKTDSPDLNIYTIYSNLDKCGKSVIAMNHAIDIANTEEKVMLVDAAISDVHDDLTTILHMAYGVNLDDFKTMPFESTDLLTINSYFYVFPKCISFDNRKIPLYFNHVLNIAIQNNISHVIFDTSAKGDETLKHDMKSEFNAYVMMHSHYIIAPFLYQGSVDTITAMKIFGNQLMELRNIHIQLMQSKKNTTFTCPILAKVFLVVSDLVHMDSTFIRHADLISDTAEEIALIFRGKRPEKMISRDFTFMFSVIIYDEELILHDLREGVNGDDGD